MPLWQSAKCLARSPWLICEGGGGGGGNGGGLGWGLFFWGGGGGGRGRGGGGGHFCIELRRGRGGEKGENPIRQKSGLRCVVGKKKEFIIILC